MSLCDRRREIRRGEKLIDPDYTHDDYIATVNEIEAELGEVIL